MALITAKKKLVELIPADYNPRRISESARKGLRSSIETFGLVQPIVWNKTTGNVVSGHQRLTILQEIGEVETTVVVVELDSIMEKALNVTMNNKIIEGEFDDDMLSVILSEIKEELPDLFADVSLDALEMPSWDNVVLPEGANTDLAESRLTTKIVVTIPKGSEFLKDELKGSIEQLIKDHFDANGISVS